MRWGLPIVVALLLGAMVFAVLFPAPVATPSIRIVVVVPPGTTGPVYLTGSPPKLGPWDPAASPMFRLDNQTYEAMLPARRGGRLEFKFTLGSWETVEKNADGSDRPNRVLVDDGKGSSVRCVVERFADGNPATRRSTVTGQLVLHDKFPSAILHNARRLWVWLPPGYDASTDHYPVLYMQDGRNCFDEATSAFGHEWSLDESATKLIATGEIRPLIIVGIDHAQDRTGEYAGPQHRFGADYADFVASEVKPFVDKSYRTLPGRDDCAIGGSSLGALAALTALEFHPETFGRAALVSPSVWFNGKRALQQLAKRPVRTSTPIWLDIGTAEGNTPAVEVANARDLSQTLEALKCQVHFEVAADAAHNEQAWAARTPAILKFLFPR